MKTIFRHAIVLALVPFANATASSFQNLDAIDAQAAEVADAKVRPVDRRLKLAACPDALQADASMSGTVIVKCESIGWRVRVNVDHGTASAGTRPFVINRGDRVNVEFVASGFSLSYSGIAQSDARMGERVAVRTDRKAAPIFGEARGQGAVRILRLN